MSKEKRKYVSARKRAEQDKQTYTASFLKLPEGVQMFKPKAERYLLDVMPYEAGEGNEFAEEGELTYERTYFVHRRVGANEETFICPRKTAGKPCPICEHAAKLMRKVEGDYEDEVQALRPKKRQLFNVRDLRQPDKGVQLFEFSFHNFGKKLHEKIMGAEEEDEDAYNQFYSLEDGMSLKVYFSEESGGGYSYVEASDIEFRPRKNQYDESDLEESHCLDDLLIIPDYDDLKEVFLEAANEKEEEEERPRRRGKDRDEDKEEEESPRSRRNGRDEDKEEEREERPRKAPKDSDADWDDFEKERKRKRDKDEDKEEEREEEERPRSRRDRDDREEESPRGRRRDKEEEEEHPRERDREQEEEERPRGRKGKDKEDDEWEEVESKAKKRQQQREEDEHEGRSRVHSDDEKEEEERPRRRRHASKDED